MTIQPLGAIALHDLNARVPFFSALSFVGEGHPIHEALAPNRQVAVSGAINPTNLKFVDIPSAEQSHHAGPAPIEAGTRQPRFVSFPLAAQNVPSTNSIALIAGLTERSVAPFQSIALYELTARPAPTFPTVAFG